MRIGRIATPDGITFCTVDEDGTTFHAISNTPFEEPQLTGKTYTADNAKLLAPILPSKVMAIGRNYADHVKEVFAKDASYLPPTMFLKPPTCIIGPGAEIKIPTWATKVEFEGEVALIVKKAAKNIKAENWRDVILGLTLINDVSSRDLQFADGQWARAKGIDTFGPLGPWIDTDLDKFDLENLPVRAYLTHDGVREMKQNSTSAQMLWSFGEIVEYVTAAYTILPGDVISTGSPAGTAPMVPGDTITIEVEGLGTLTNPIAEASTEPWTAW